MVVIKYMALAVDKAFVGGTILLQEDPLANNSCCQVGFEGVCCFYTLNAMTGRVPPLTVSPEPITTRPTLVAVMTPGVNRYGPCSLSLYILV